MKKKYDTDNLTDVFFALSDSNRLKIIQMLAEKEFSCGELASALKVSLPTVTHHLDILIRVGIVEKRREGVWKYGVLRPQVIDEAFEKLKNNLK